MIPRSVSGEPEWRMPQTGTLARGPVCGIHHALISMRR